MYLMLCLSMLSTLVFVALWGVKTQHKVTSRPCQEGRLSSIDLVLLKTESKEGAYVDTVDTDLSRTFRIPDEKPSI